MSDQQQDGEPGDDPYCETLGITYETIEPGFARTRLEVEERHLNFQGALHGGAIFSLADAAFAAAGNAGDESSVALEANVSFLAPVPPGSTLIAEANRTHSGGRTAQYELTVSLESGDLVASLRGRAYRT